jgi:hypothetical protein
MFLSWFFCGNPLAGKGHLPKPGVNIPEHDAIPEKLAQLPRLKRANFSGMTQLRSVFVVSEVKNA